MNYLDYELSKKKYQEAKNTFEQILTEQEELFSITQANVLRYEKGKSRGGKKRNLFDYYLIQKEKNQIDERLAEAKKILLDREYILKLQETELRQNKNYFDTIYVLKFLDGLSAEKIAIKTNYSTSQIYRKIEKIKNAIKCGRKGDKI